jgi:hypothetical protein
MRRCALRGSNVARRIYGLQLPVPPRFPTLTPTHTNTASYIQLISHVIGQRKKLEGALGYFDLFASSS